jgi:DNA adenine methylase
MNAPLRPALRYHGGKWRIAPWIIAHFPPHRVYVEPFGGAASVLLRKPRSYAEVYNELSGDVVNFFRVLRDDDMSARLLREIALTPFARDEFEGAYAAGPDPVDRARALAVRSMMGFGSNGHNARVKTGFRANSNRSGTTPAHDWANYPEALAATIDRLRGVIVENRDAVACMSQHDGPQTLHYVDPPYPMGTRSLRNPYDLKYRATGATHRAGCYDHEMSDDAHQALLGALRTLSGSVVLSGYPSPLYDAALDGWMRVECAALADGARARTEVLWLNPRAADGLAQRSLFSGASP